MFQSEYMYCAQDHSIYMEGTRDSAVMREKHAYITYDVVRCTHGTREPKDPVCAKEEEIDAWLLHKKIFLRLINDKINF